jgi:hypothetical protein
MGTEEQSKEGSDSAVPSNATPESGPTLTPNSSSADPELVETVATDEGELQPLPGVHEAPHPLLSIGEFPYNSDASRDTTRQTITLWLIGLLCAIVVLTFVALFASGASIGFKSKEFIDELKAILNVLVGPVITLLASAVGFYFGSTKADTNKQSDQKDKRP